jgi:hypothetical protein
VEFSEEALRQAKLSTLLKNKILEAIAEFWEEQPDQALEVAEHVVWLAMTDVLVETGKAIGRLQKDVDAS